MVNLDLPILNRVKNILTKTEKIDTDVTSVLTKLAEQGVDIDSIIASIGTSGDQASAATIFGKLAGLASQSGGAVKSVQRIKIDQLLEGKNATYINYFDSTISTINVDKTILIVKRMDEYYQDPSTGTMDNDTCLAEHAEILNATTVRCYPTRSYSSGSYEYYRSYKLYIQVIEFY